MQANPTSEEVFDVLREVALFEPNTPATHKMVVDALLKKFPQTNVVCDETNNPEAIVNGGRFVVTVNEAKYTLDC